MVKYQEESKETKLDQVFHALSDRTRRAILSRLASGDVVVGELAEPFAMSLPAISKHLGVLEKAGLVQRHKDGRIRRCELNAGPLESASDWIGFYRNLWNKQLDSLAEYLEKNSDKNIEQNKDNSNDQIRVVPNNVNSSDQEEK